jgi:predicted CXXCH cytochrome family protein
MKRVLRESGHLVRPAVALLAAVVLFILLRRAVVPPSFGQYGHYRGAALEENRIREAKYAGRAVCELCHDPQLVVLQGGRHAKISCEACHGPQPRHVAAADPALLKPARPEAAPLCRRCHESDSAKPKFLPQVVTAEHYGNADCSSCHQPHRPKEMKPGKP